MPKPDRAAQLTLDELLRRHARESPQGARRRRDARRKRRRADVARAARTRRAHGDAAVEPGRAPRRARRLPTAELPRFRRHHARDAARRRGLLPADADLSRARGRILPTPLAARACSSFPTKRAAAITPARSRRCCAKRSIFSGRSSAAARARRGLRRAHESTHALPATEYDERFGALAAAARRAASRSRSMPPRSTLVAADPKAIAQLLFTSGTSGEPKGVLHRNDVLMRAAAMEIEHLGLGAKDRVFVPSPLAHQTGFLYGMWLALLMGVPQIVQPVWNASRALRALNDWDGTFVQAATPFLADLVHAVEGGERSSGGAANLRRDRRSRAARFGRARDAHSRHGSLRRVGNDRIVSGDRSRRPATNPQRSGEPTGARCAAFACALPTPMAARCPPARKGTSRCTRRRCSRAMPIIPNGRPRPYTPDGWFRTGDLGVMDEAGYIRITGRVRDVINRGGEKIPVARDRATLERSSGDRRGRDRRDARSALRRTRLRLRRVARARAARLRADAALSLRLPSRQALLARAAGDRRRACRALRRAKCKSTSYASARESCGHTNACKASIS